MDGTKKLSVVVPVYNEADNLRPLVSAVTDQLALLDLAYEMVLVDDGSSDASLKILRELANEHSFIRAVSFSRNFGHQAAITAGLEHAEGDAVIVMDGDLQHPPELIPQMVAEWHNGAQIVFTIRQDTEETGRLKRLTSAAFYRCINLLSDVPITPGAADFRLMDRVAVDALLEMPERSRFLRGMINWLGFRQVGLRYQVHSRLHGQSKYSLRRMLSFALQGITSFSTLPLRMSGILGLVAASAGIPYALWAIYAKLFTNTTVPGWTSILVVIMFLGGVQLMSIGILGEYIGRIYTEVKARPNYLVGELIGFQPAEQVKTLQRRSAISIPAPHFHQVSQARSEATHS